MARERTGPGAERAAELARVWLRGERPKSGDFGYLQLTSEGSVRGAIMALTVGQSVTRPTPN